MMSIRRREVKDVYLTVHCYVCDAQLLNPVACIMQSISKMVSLQSLQLESLQLNHLPKGVTALTNLEGLWVHTNPLKDLPDGLLTMPAIKRLSLPWHMHHLNKRQTASVIVRWC